MNETSWVDCGDGVRLERGVRARMRDGVELVSDHYYSPQPGPQPTLLMRQPYGRDIASTVVYAHPVWFARHGYNVVIQDVRGRGDSEGEFYPFRNEGPDGADTIAWLRVRPECNGRIGMYGFSYQGMAQFLAAAEQPEGLQCISPGMTAFDLYHGWFYQHGALRFASTLGWGLQMLKADARRKKLRDASDRLEQAWTNLAAQTGVLPFRAHPALHGEGLPAYVLDWLDHDAPGEYWSALDVSSRLEKISVPALHVSGWYDVYLRGSVDGFLGLCKSAGSEFARENQFLLAGPWVHIPWGDRIGSADFGPEALLDTDTILLRWFDHWLKDSGAFTGKARVRHFVLGENAWSESDTFPTEAKYALYLRSGGRANSRKGDGRLSIESPQADEPCDVFVHDPEVPVVAPGGTAAAIGPFDQSALEMGNNVLVYSTEPLEAPLW
ncbi:MAG TPA: CocE/NonD family hydrolase, partial [Candidatus Acidoferrales bacterium]|nr:CocE/NonD family hydrolase [Candidatus Acidoferrales bacterium]